jgi:hypothetical protein
MGQPTRGTAGVSADAYANAVNRLRINFRVAVYTTVLAVVLLLASAAAMIVLLLVGEPITAAVPAVVGVLDIAWGVSERPWRQLLLANNRIALSDSLWVSYLETKDAIISSGLDGTEQLAEILRAQNLWVTRIAAIAQDDYAVAFRTLREVNERSEAIQQGLLESVQDVQSAVQSYEGVAVSAARKGLTLGEIYRERELRRTASSGGGGAFPAPPARGRGES